MVEFRIWFENSRAERTLLIGWMWIVKKDLDFQVFVLSSGKDGVRAFTEVD